MRALGVLAFERAYCTGENTEKDEEIFERLSRRYTFGLPRFPSSCYSNIDIIFDRAGRNIYEVVEEAFSHLPIRNLDDESIVHSPMCRTVEFLLFPQKIVILLETPLIAAIHEIQASAVKVFNTNFSLLEHIQFCFLVFFLKDNRLYEQLRVITLSFIEDDTRDLDEDFTLDCSLSHTLTYMLSQHLPPQSTSSVTVEFREYSDMEINPYKQLVNDREPAENRSPKFDILSAVHGMTINLMHTWPVSEIITLTHLDGYNTIMQTLLSITCAKWTAESIWKRATDFENLSKVSQMNHSVTGSARNPPIICYYKKCLVGLHWFQYILSGLLGYYLRRIHEGIWTSFLAKFEKCASIDDLSKAHANMLDEVSVIVKFEKAQIENVVYHGYRATTAFIKALTMLNSPIADLSERALGVPAHSSKPLIEVFFERSENAFKNLRMAVKALSTSLDNAILSSNVGRSSAPIGLSELQAVFIDLKNWL